MTLKYLSHGPAGTGGHRHERFLFHCLRKALDVQATELRFEKQYKGLFAWMNLFSLAFFNAADDIVITVSRLAWPVAWRNRMRKNKQLLVLHNYDSNDGKPSLYHSLLRSFIQSKIKRHPEKYALVTVSPYWQKFFVNEFALYFSHVFYFPNFFDNNKYIQYRVNTKNNKLIHLGMWSDKIDKEQYKQLLDRLQAEGYTAYFSSPEQIKISGIPIEIFETHEAFLERMSTAYATVIINKVHEGWPRLVHESFLCGTQVLANDKGGLPKLLRTGNGHMIQSVTEIVQILNSGQLNKINFTNFDNFDESAVGNYIAPIIQWINE